MYNYDTQNYSKSCFNHMTFLGNKFSYTLVHLIKIFKFPSLPSIEAVDEFWHMNHHTCGKLMHGG